MNAGSPSAKAASVIRTLEPVVANMSDLGLLSKSYIYGFDEMKIQYNKSVCKASDHTGDTPWLAGLGCAAGICCSSLAVVARLLAPHALLGLSQSLRQAYCRRPA